MSNGTALAIVENAKNSGALVFANMQNFEAEVELYKTEVTQLSFNEKDFHTISGKKMPNKAATDKIGEACGVQFVESACRVTAENRDDPPCGKRTVFRAEAQGKVRMPDGSWRFSTVDEYEFDPVLRAMLDKNVTELTPEVKRNIGKAIMELSKVARQRAATGARLRVIRQLTGMPAAFDATDASRQMVFTRVVQNTGYILNTPEGRAMATAQALGVDMSTLFGGRKMLSGTAPQQEPERQVDNVGDTAPDDTSPPVSAAAMAEEASGNDEPDFPDEPTGPEFERLSHVLTEFMDGYKDVLDVMSKNGKNPYKMAEEELNNPNATIETRQSMIDRLRNWLKAKGINV